MGLLIDPKVYGSIAYAGIPDVVQLISAHPVCRDCTFVAAAARRGLTAILTAISIAFNLGSGRLRSLHEGTHPLRRIHLIEVVTAP